MNSVDDKLPSYVVNPPAVTSLPVRGTKARFPIRRVYCVGRNYAAHAIEMGHDPNKEPPFFFQKNPDNVATDGRFPYPSATKDVHFEIELVVALKSGGTNIKAADAMKHVFGYAVGIDMTRRDLQAEAKKAGRPWDMAKGFDASAPIGEIAPASRIGHPANGRIELAVNGTTRQLGDLADMIWSVPEAIAYLSGLVTLMPGDLIFTGTPAGVAAVQGGDRLEGAIAGVGTVSVTIA
jgi:fumarylpyruvate hydrolase